jgi:hypothetical protein
MRDELEIKVNQEGITPFWRKLPFFFAFPFRFGPLVFMVAIVAASAIAGLALGAFGMIFKGMLVYLGLRYAFNVLELFSKGRFEGESVDHRLWGPEKRPAKLALVLTLFIVAALQGGQAVVSARLAKNSAAQDLVVVQYKQSHGEELALLEREHREHQARVAEARALAASKAAAAQANDAEDAEALRAEAAELAQEAQDMAREGPPALPAREVMVKDAAPSIGEPLWFRLVPVWYWVVVAVASLLLPAAAVVIALEDSFFRALNPLNALTLLQAMGRAYFVLWLFFLAIAGTRHLVLTTGSDLPAMVRFPLEMGLATYLGLVLFAIMGYALYQYHQELHLDVDVDFDDHRQAGGAEAIAAAGSARTAISRNAAPVDPLTQKIDAALARGDIQDAIAEVKDRMRYDKLDPKLNERLHELLVRQGDAGAVQAQGQQWLTALAKAGQGREGLAALRKLQALQPQFVVQDGDAVLPLAQAAVRERDFAGAVALLRQFDKRFPGHADTPGVFFLGARLMSEQNRQHDKAARLLRGVLATYPDHPQTEEVRTYLGVLESLIARSAASAA